MNNRIIAAMAATVVAALPCATIAQDSPKYLCTLGELQRRVEIIYETGVQVPCEVHYHKDTEAPGQPQVLWRALNEAGYCEAQTAEFIEQLEGMGWTCGQATSPAEAGEPIEIDDTEDLLPAEEEAPPEPE